VPEGSRRGRDPRRAQSLRRGAVSIPHAFAGTNVGRITTTRTDLDPLTDMVLLVGMRVKVEPVRT
jgi:hypothetical protein